MKGSESIDMKYLANAKYMKKKVPEGAIEEMRR